MNLTPLNLNSLDPFDGLRSFQREVSRILDAATTRQNPGRFPLLNVQSDANVAVVTAEIPGASPDDLEITLVKGQLTLRGTIRDAAPEGEGVVTHRKERVSGKFVRTVGLPFEIEDGGISATYQNGVLEVTLPRAEKSKPKSIPIHVN
jgi:HSP20 family protein